MGLERGEVPNRRSFSAAELTSFKASPNVYGLSLFALRRGLNILSRKDRRVWVPPMSRMEEMVTGRVELLLIYLLLATSLSK